MQVLTVTAIIWLLIVGNSIFAQDRIELTKEQMEKYVGKYVITQNDVEKERAIIIKENILFYVVNDDQQIPLKPLSETELQLYPSKTYIQFYFGENGEVKNILIKTGSGREIEGVKTN